MATEFILRRSDCLSFGSFEQVKSRIRDVFPTAEFYWNISGPEKIALAAERGITFPHEIMEFLPALPSLLEGVAEGIGFHVTFGLGPQEPVQCLYVTPLGDAPELERGLAVLEAEAGSEFKVAGEEEGGRDAR